MLRPLLCLLLQNQMGTLAGPTMYPQFPCPLMYPLVCPLLQNQMGTLAGPVMYEQIIHFYNWLGLALAVASQPVIVNVAASAESFRAYPGVSAPCQGPEPLVHRARTPVASRVVSSPPLSSPLSSPPLL